MKLAIATVLALLLVVALGMLWDWLLHLDSLADWDEPS